MYIRSTPVDREIEGKARIQVAAKHASPLSEDMVDEEWDYVEREIYEILIEADYDADVSDLDADYDGFTATVEVPVEGRYTVEPSCDEYEPDDCETVWDMDDAENGATLLKALLAENGYTDIKLQVLEPAA